VKVLEISTASEARNDERKIREEAQILREVAIQKELEAALKAIAVIDSWARLDMLVGGNVALNAGEVREICRRFLPHQRI
jgi:hypothetical protein